MGERVIKTCDECGIDLDEGTGAILKLTYVNKSRGAIKADFCDRCAGKISGRPTKTRRAKRGSSGAVSASDSSPET